MVKEPYIHFLSVVRNLSGFPARDEMRNIAMFQPNRPAYRNLLWVSKNHRILSENTSLFSSFHNRLRHLTDTLRGRGRIQNPRGSSCAVSAELDDIVAVIRCADAGRNHDQRIRIDFMYSYPT